MVETIILSNNLRNRSGFRMNHIAVIMLVIAALCVAFVFRVEPAEAKTGVTVTVGNKTFNGVLYDSATSNALMKKLPLGYRMSDLNGNEKYKYLKYSLPANEKPVKKIKAGDIMLYGDDCLVVFYKSFKTSYEYTRVGRITNVKGLAKAAGKGKVTIKISKKKKIALNKRKMTLNPGQTASLKLSGAPKAKVKWKSSNRRIVTVSKGKIKAKKTGTAKVTAAYKNKKYVCRITVKKKTVSKKNTEPTSQPATTSQPVTSDQNETDPTEGPLTLYIDDTRVSVSWQDNEAVAKLKEILRNSPLEIRMNEYGGFEQVGSIGTSLPTADTQMTTEPGDIVLYSGNQMVIFYGSNSWSYTKLGHIENMSTNELAGALSGADKTIRITME